MDDSELDPTPVYLQLRGEEKLTDTIRVMKTVLLSGIIISTDSPGRTLSTLRLFRSLWQTLINRKEVPPDYEKRGLRVSVYLDDFDLDQQRYLLREMKKLNVGLCTRRVEAIQEYQKLYPPNPLPKLLVVWVGTEPISLPTPGLLVVRLPLSSIKPAESFGAIP